MTQNPTGRKKETWHDRYLMYRSLEMRIADSITAFCGSMTFVYIHAAIFAVWCYTGLFGLDPYPYNFLTMAVSLEAIFLSTFVMIGQMSQSARDRRQADADYQTNIESEHRIEGVQRELGRIEIEKLDTILDALPKTRNRPLSKQRRARLIALLKENRSQSKSGGSGTAYWESVVTVVDEFLHAKKS